MDSLYLVQERRGKPWTIRAEQRQSSDLGVLGATRSARQR